MSSPSVCKTYNVLLGLLILALLSLLYIFSTRDQDSSDIVTNNIRKFHYVELSSDPTVHFGLLDHASYEDASALNNPRLKPSEPNSIEVDSPESTFPPATPHNSGSVEPRPSIEPEGDASQYSTDSGQILTDVADKSLPPLGPPAQQNILIVSTWRSGSTTFSRILSSDKNSFLHYEPLDGHYTASLTDPDVSRFVTNITDKLLSCDYESVNTQYLRDMYYKRAYLKENNKVPNSCKVRGKAPNPCLNATYMSEQCGKYSVQIIKYVRVSLAQVAHYLKQYSNFKVIWLARDPRAVWYSRLNNKLVSFWCLPGLCGDLNRLCQSYEINWRVSEQLQYSYPDSFLRVRFEDIQQNPYREAERITKFLNPQNPEDIFDKIKLLDSRTNFTTRKDWRDNLSNEIRLEVERSCNDTMYKLGYL